ncbi:MAG TPA: hypothetical protein VL551_05230 [Actinospica sp.]|jgi:hypothetical protein|nr:hypothetical protein [Actinospica sp.]
MLTQIQLPEPQAAVLAACPRPRAVAPSTALPQLSASSSPAWSGEVRLGSVVEERRRERGVGSAVDTRPVGYASAARVIAAGIVVSGFGTNGMTSSKKQDQHLTARRGPVTWRPPH